MTWWNDYMEIPFADHGRDRRGCDCYGLVRLVLAERFGVDLPPMTVGYDSAADREAVAGMIAGNALLTGFEQVKTVRPGDVLVIRQAGSNCHLAVVVAPGLALHTERGKGVVVESYNRPHLRPRIREVWRHESI